MELPSPAQLKQEYPLLCQSEIASWRNTAKKILRRTDPRLVVIVGPCSIHDPESVLEYAHRLKNLSLEIDKTFFPILRFFIEKPRTRLGWKGMLYDPDLNGSHDIALGLRKSRELLLKIIELGVPCATEILEPIAASYFDDLIVWGLVGARTSASQPHRQLASGLPYPVGFKNDCRGDLDVAISAILSARAHHSHMGINPLGKVAAITTQGNLYTHLVLRGSDTSANYDAVSVNEAVRLLEERQLEPSLIVDCSHGNCGKDHKKQIEVFEAVMRQENQAIAGLMLESHINGGRQPLGDNPADLSYGVSITDPCLSWEETESLLRSMSMSFVQN